MYLNLLSLIHFVKGECAYILHVWNGLSPTLRYSLQALIYLTLHLVSKNLHVKEDNYTLFESLLVFGIKGHVKLFRGLTK